MPPRHNYWTIIFGNQPTSFRAATREELLPTLRQIQAKHPDAVMMWFASGRLWRSEEEFRDARFKRREPDRGRDERDRSRDPRGPRPPAFARKPFKPGYGEAAPKARNGRDWRDRPHGPRPPFKPGYGAPPPVPPKPRSGEGGKPRSGEGWKPRSGEGGKPRSGEGWKPGSGEGGKPRSGEGWKPGSGEGWKRRDGEWKERPRGPKPQWTDKAREGERPQAPRPKDRWRDRPVPPAGGSEKRGRDWRPGGQHKDPRDRFKVPRDVKRARFKARARHDRINPRPPKKKDEE